MIASVGEKYYFVTWKDTMLYPLKDYVYVVIYVKIRVYVTIVIKIRVYDQNKSLCHYSDHFYQVIKIRICID